MSQKKIVINKVFNKFTSEFISQLFRPQWSTNRPDPIESKQNITISALPTYSAPTNPFQPLFLANLPYNISTNPVTYYNKFVGASNCFLVTGEFINFLDALVDKIFASKQNTFINWAYKADGSLDTTYTTLNPLYKEFGPFIEDIELNAKADALIGTKPSQNLLEFFLRHIYSLSTEARNVAIDKFGTQYGLSALTTKAKLGIIPFVDFDSDKLAITLQDDGLLTFNYSEPIKLERRFDKAELNDLGVDTDNIYLFFPQIQAGLVSRNVPNYYYSKTAFIGRYRSTAAGAAWEYFNNTPHWTNTFFSQKDTDANPSKKAVYKQTAPYVALSIGSVEENTNSSTPYDIVTDHTDVIDYMDNILFNIITPKRYK